MLRQRIFAIIEDKPPIENRASLVFNWSLMILIWLNVIAVVLGSMYELYDRFHVFFAYFEIFTVVVFATEYLLRVWVAQRKFRYIFSPMGIIDLLAILPFFLTFLVGIDLRALRIIRTFRLLRILKLARYNKAFELIVRVLQRQKEKLFIAVFFMFMMLLLSSFFMFFVENPVQPDKFPSIPATLWWAIGSFAGHGDAYPITSLGRVFNGIIAAIMGIGMIAMPSGIISMGMIKELEKDRKKKKRRKKMEAAMRQANHHGDHEN